MTPEGAVKKACEDLLKAERIPYWRMNAGNAVIPGRGRIRLNAPGTADLLAAPNSCALHFWDNHIEKECAPIFLWIECKAPGKSATDLQVQFGTAMRNRGHHWLELDDVKALQDWLKEHRAR